MKRSTGMSWLPDIDSRPLNADPNPIVIRGHCHDAEKCNADTFCDCPCARCMKTKRGEYDAR